MLRTLALILTAIPTAPWRLAVLGFRPPDLDKTNAATGRRRQPGPHRRPWPRSRVTRSDRWTDQPAPAAPFHLPRVELNASGVDPRLLLHYRARHHNRAGGLEAWRMT